MFQLNDCIIKVSTGSRMYFLILYWAKFINYTNYISYINYINDINYVNNINYINHIIGIWRIIIKPQKA